MNKAIKSLKLLAVSVLALGVMAPSSAETDKVVLAKQWGIGSLTFIVMQHDKLYEKALAEEHLDRPVSVQWVKFTGGAMMNDAMLSGNLNFAMAGVPPLLTMWEKTRGNLGVMGVAAANSMPMLLNTRNPAVRTIADFTNKDRIALPGVKVSIQAILLEMAAAKQFGGDHYAKLDPLTVTLSHADGMMQMLSGKSPVNSHFTSPPYTYLELDHPGVHTVLNSYKILGGPATLNVVYTTTKFHNENPKVYAAFLKAFKQATEFIGAHKEKAAETYLEVTGDKSLSKDQLVKILSNPDIRYTLTPQRTMEVARFMHKTGRLKVEPKSWKDMFFPDVHELPGS